MQDEFLACMAAAFCCTSPVAVYKVLSVERLPSGSAKHGSEAAISSRHAATASRSLLGGVVMSAVFTLKAYEKRNAAVHPSSLYWPLLEAAGMSLLDRGSEQLFFLVTLDSHFFAGTTLSQHIPHSM